MPSVEFEQSVEAMPRENRFRAMVYAVGTLLQEKGICSPIEIEEKFLEWDRRERAREECKNHFILDTGAIIQTVGRHFGLSSEEVKSKTNAREVVVPRQIAMYLMVKLKELSLPATARHFGKHHTTVMHSIEIVEKRRAVDADYDRLIEQIISELE